MRPRLRVAGGTLLHLEAARVQRADVLVEDGVIVGLEPTPRPLPGERVFDATGQWLLPGLVCGHTHLYSALSCGMPLPTGPHRDFADMLARVWWRLDEALDAEAVEVSAWVGGVAALRAGVTTLVDHHASPSCIEGSLERIDGALGGLGLRRVLCYEVTDRGGPKRAAAGLRAHEALLAAPADGRRAVMVGAHANFTLGDDTLRRCGALAREAGVGLHIHVAEAEADARLTGEDLVARLDRLGALLPDSLLAHCVHLDAAALRRVADAGAWVAHQPRSNMNNAVGHAPVAAFGERTLLGTDGIGADMLAELQAGWLRGQEAGVPWSPARWVAALAAGGRFASGALGVTVGRLEVGARADLVVLDPQPGPPLRDDNLAAALIFRLSAAAVRHVLVDGELVLLDRAPVHVDLTALDRRANAAAEALWRRMAPAP